MKRNGKRQSVFIPSIVSAAAVIVIALMLDLGGCSIKKQDQPVTPTLLTYDINSEFDDSEIIISNSNGTIISKAQEGEKVYIRKVNNKIKNIYVDNDIIVYDVESERYVFTMPSHNVNLTLDYIDSYSITVNNVGHDNTTVIIKNGYGNEISSALEGELITLEVTNTSSTETISAVKANGNDLVLKNGIYQFEMPNMDVVITIEYGNTNALTVSSSIHSDTTITIKNKDGKDITSALEGEEIYVTATTSTTSELIKEIKYNDNVITPTSDGIYKFTMPASNVEISVTYSTIYSISLSKAIHTDTTVSIKDNEGNDLTSCLAGKEVVVSVSSSSTTEVVSGVKYNDTELTLNDGLYTFTMPEENVVISVIYDSIHSINLSSGIHNDTIVKIKDSEGNNITSSIKGKEVTLEVSTSNECETIKDVKYNGTSIIGNDGIYTFTMPNEDVTITVEYEDLYLLSADSIHTGTKVTFKDSDGNTITRAKKGETVYVNVSTTSISEIIKKVMYNGTALTLKDGTYSFTMPSNNVVITIEYESLYTLNVASSVHSYTSIKFKDDDGNVISNALAGTNINLDITNSSDGEVIKSVKYNDTVINPTLGKYSFTMPSEDVSITVEYENLYTLCKASSVHDDTTVTFKNTSGETITKALAGDEITLDISITSTTEEIKSVKYNDTEITPSNGVYTFTMPSENVEISIEYNHLYSLTLGECHATNTTVKFEDKDGNEISKAKVGDIVYVNATTTSTTETIGGIKHDGIKVVAKDSDGKYSFTMLEGDCTVDIIYNNEIVQDLTNYVVFGSDSNGSIDWNDSVDTANYGDVLYIYFSSSNISNVKVNNVDCTKYEIDQGSGVIVTVYKFTMPNTVATITFDKAN